MDEVLAFLEKWKPFASLPPGNAVRRSILRLLGTEDAGERAKILAKVNGLYGLHGIYQGLGILREGGGAKWETFAQLLGISVADFATAIDNAYSAVGKIKWEGMHYRKDIGQRAAAP